jgi:hypothetical protein
LHGVKKERGQAVEEEPACSKASPPTTFRRKSMAANSDWSIFDRLANRRPAIAFLSPGSHVQDLDLVTVGEESVWPFRAQQRHPVVFHQNCFADERKSFDQIVDVFRSNGFLLAV